jgi:hypothetical protein
MKGASALGSRGLSAFGPWRLIRLVLLRVGDPFVELGERELDPDLRQGENGAGDQDFVRPCVAERA